MSFPFPRRSRCVVAWPRLHRRRGHGGYGSFENDDALEFLSDLDRGAGWEVVAETLLITGKPDELDGASILAAGEVVAAVNDSPAERLPESATKWVSENGAQYKRQLLEEAIHAVALVAAEDSDLRRLWESTDPGPWLQAVSDLQRRLSHLVHELDASV